MSDIEWPQDSAPYIPEPEQLYWKYYDNYFGIYSK